MSVEDTSVPGFGVGVVVTLPTNVGQKSTSVFEHLVDHMNRCTPAYYGKMSHFIALVASIFCGWAVSLPRGVLTIAISTVPAACLEGSPLGVWFVSLLYFVLGLRVWLVASLGDTLNLGGFLFV